MLKCARCTADSLTASRRLRVCVVHQSPAPCFHPLGESHALRAITSAPLPRIRPRASCALYHYARQLHANSTCLLLLTLFLVFSVCLALQQAWLSRTSLQVATVAAEQHGMCIQGFQKRCCCRFGTHTSYPGRCRMARRGQACMLGSVKASRSSALTLQQSFSAHTVQTLASSEPQLPAKLC